MNVKKIAAAAAGAAMLGAAFAGAVAVDEAVGSFPFFAAGAPNFKIVVGSASQPSDAVVAANLAVLAGNLAYTSKDIVVTGQDGLSCSAGAASGGSNATVTGQKVSLEVSTPGVNPNVKYQMKTYTGDASTGTTGYLDFSTTDDRTNSLGGSTSSIVATDGTTGGRKITSYESPLVWKGTLSDTVNSKSYTEEERYLIYGKTEYDTGSKKVKSKNPQIAYEAQFTNPIQVCTDATPSTQASENTVCTESYFTPKHRLKVKMLGADWILYQMNNFPTSGSVTPSSTQVVMGKEVQYKEFMQIGDEITAPNGIKVKLKDISPVATGSPAQLPASFDVYDASGTIIDSATLTETSNPEYSKNGIVVKLLKAFTGTTPYAQVNIFSNKLSLTHGSTVDSDNTNWQVTLVGGGTAYGASLARIQLIRQVVDDLNIGDSVSFLSKPALMKLNFDGLETATYDTLTFSTGQKSFPTGTTDTSTSDISYVMGASSLTNPFNFGSTSTNTFYYVTDGTETGNATRGLVFYQDPTTGVFKPYFSTGSWANVTFGSSAAVTLSAASTGGVSFFNTSTGSAGIQCGSAIANGTAITAGTFTVPSAAAVAGLEGVPATMGTAITFGGGAAPFGNLTVQATAINGVTCTTGVNVTLQFAAGATGTATFGGIDATGVAFAVTNNTVPYSYGSSSRNMVLIPGAITNTASSDPTAANGYALIVPEFMLDTDATTGAGSIGAWLLDIGSGSDASPRLGPSSGTAYLGYNATYLPATSANGNVTGQATFEAGFVSPRGSVGESIGSSNAKIKYATTLAHALYSLSGAGTATGGNTATNDYAKGETPLDLGGYKVVVKDFKGTATAGSGSCSAGTVAGSDKLAASEKKAFVVTPLNPATTPVVLFDSQASGVGNAIVVGGPMVNTVAAKALQGAAAMKTGDAVVKVYGDKLVVAGYSASDTQEAGRTLMAWMASNLRK